MHDGIFVVTLIIYLLLVFVLSILTFRSRLFIVHININLLWPLDNIFIDCSMVLVLVPEVQCDHWQSTGQGAVLQSLLALDDRGQLSPPAMRTRVPACERYRL